MLLTSCRSSSFTKFLPLSPFSLDGETTACPCPKLLPTTPQLVLINPNSNPVALPLCPHTSCGPPYTSHALHCPPSPLPSCPSPLNPLPTLATLPPALGAPRPGPLAPLPTSGPPHPGPLAPLPAPRSPPLDPIETVKNATSMLRRPLPLAATSPPPDPPRLPTMTSQSAMSPKMHGQNPQSNCRGPPSEPGECVIFSVPW
jgi:hypothetical protein